MKESFAKNENMRTMSCEERRPFMRGAQERLLLRNWLNTVPQDRDFYTLDDEERERRMK